MDAQDKGPTDLLRVVFALCPSRRATPRRDLLFYWLMEARAWGGRRRLIIACRAGCAVEAAWDEARRVSERPPCRRKSRASRVPVRRWDR